eukprot:RCo055182
MCCSVLFFHLISASLGNTKTDVTGRDTHTRFPVCSRRQSSSLSLALLFSECGSFGSSENPERRRLIWFSIGFWCAVGILSLASVATEKCCAVRRFPLSCGCILLPFFTHTDTDLHVGKHYCWLFFVFFSTLALTTIVVASLYPSTAGSVCTPFWLSERKKK